MRPNVCILRSDGANCDEELFYAFEKFGANPDYVQINELRNKTKNLKDFQILALPGGFSYGDDILSGKVLALELLSYLRDQLAEFVEKKRFILGICNGFQTLIRTGLLPYNNLGQIDATLVQNDSGHFECRWVKIKIEKSACKFMPSGQILDMAVNHGEGKFFAEPKSIQKIEKQKLVIARYVDKTGKPTQRYPANPNGSIKSIAGVVDPSGRILGMMPHPEKFVDVTQHPNWRRQKFEKPHGSIIFENLINFAKKS